MANTARLLHPSITPTLSAFATGRTIAPLWVAPNGRSFYPIAGGAPDDDGDGTSGPGSGSGDTGTGKQGNEPKWPANTPPDQMTDAQRAAYYADQSAKWEGRATKNYGILRDLGISSPEEAAAIKDKVTQHDALERELMSDKDKAVEEAKTQASTAADEKYRPLIAETAFRVAIGDRKPKDEVDDFIADLNLSRFLTDDGTVDTAKVLARVDQFAPVKGTTTERRGPQITAGGTSSGGSGGGSLTGLAGDELYDRLHPKKQQAS